MNLIKFIVCILSLVAMSCLGYQAIDYFEGQVFFDPYTLMGAVACLWVFINLKPIETFTSFSKGLEETWKKNEN